MKTRLDALIDGVPDGAWVRAESVRYVRGGIDLYFVVLRSRRGTAIRRWLVTCRGVSELSVSDLDGGGIRLYSGTHIAARQYSASRARLWWRPSGRGSEALGVLLAAHSRLVDDWIPFDRYTSDSGLGSSVVSWQGPDFIMRAYARALRGLGLEGKVVLGGRRRPTVRARCLHFGNSFVVAARFGVGSGAT